VKGYAAEVPDSQEMWHSHLADCFEAFGPGGERLLPAKFKGSFPTFCWDSCYLGECVVADDLLPHAADYD
jgi:hypothetical protein